MERIIYHGSDHVIMKPTSQEGNSRNDFGRGFYCTEEMELAKEWACKKGTDGFVNIYHLNLEGLKICNLTEDKYHILHWLALLARYRSYWQKKSIAEQAKEYLKDHYLIDLSDYDVIIGYRADDSYFSFAQDFVMGTISIQTLSEAMRLGKLGEQIVIKSEKAFNQLHYEGCEISLAEEYYVKKASRDLLARTEYQRMKKEQDYATDIFMLDILRGRVTEDELRVF